MDAWPKLRLSDIEHPPPSWPRLEERKNSWPFLGHLLSHAQVFRGWSLIRIVSAATCLKATVDPNHRRSQLGCRRFVLHQQSAFDRQGPGSLSPSGLYDQIQVIVSVLHSNHTAEKFDTVEKNLASLISITYDIHDRNFLEIQVQFVKGIRQCHVCWKYGCRLEVYGQADR